MKKAALGLMACIMLFSLAGCSSSFDASKHVKGNLDAIYLGIFDEEYVDSIVDTLEECQASYEEGLSYEAQFFMQYSDMDETLLSDETKQEIVDLYRDIYSHSKYDVGDATESNGTYLVSVTIHPMDIIQKFLEEDNEALMTTWEERGAAGEFEEMSDAEFEEAWARLIIDAVKARLDNIGYLDPETISVQVVKEEGDDGEYYIISDSDFQRIDEVMIAY